MSYWLGFDDAMGSLAGGEQSAMQPPVTLQLAKIPVPTGPPDEELDGDPEDDPEGDPDDDPEGDPEDDPEGDPEDDPEDELPDDDPVPPEEEPEPDPELPDPPELLLLPVVDEPAHAATPKAISPSA